MWKNFQKVLENRVKKKNSYKPKNIRPDKYTVIASIKKIIKEDYGKEGLKNIKIEIPENSQAVVFMCKNPAWKNELKLKKDIYKEKINQQIKGEWVRDIKFW